jgi:hypothetical protein
MPGVQRLSLAGLLDAGWDDDLLEDSHGKCVAGADWAFCVRAVHEQAK